MCAKISTNGRELVSLFNRTKSKLSIKTFRVTLLQQILNASHVDLMTENNVCKTIRQKIFFVLYNMSCSKCSNMWIWTSTITKVSLLWHQQTDSLFFKFHVPCMFLTFHFLLSHYNFRVSHQYLRSLCYWSHPKANAVNRITCLCFY